jgi:hypothetical protein
MLRTLRGVIGTAFAWALPWALVGGAALAVLGYVSLSSISPPTLRILLEMFLNGAVVAGGIGAFSGAAFAGIVTLSERPSAFSDLSLPRLAAWGAAGGGTTALAFLGAASVADARILWPLWPLFGLSAGLGAASAATMYWLARHDRDLGSPPALGAGAAVPSLPAVERDAITRRRSQ